MKCKWFLHRDELFSLFNYVNDAHKVAFRGMQALNTSGLLELMENVGAAGECKVETFSPSFKTQNLDRNLCWVDCPTIARSRINCLQWTRSCGWCTLQGFTAWRYFSNSFSSNPMEIKADTVAALGSGKLGFAKNALPKLSFLPQCFFDKVGIKISSQNSFFLTGSTKLLGSPRVW